MVAQANGPVQALDLSRQAAAPRSAPDQAELETALNVKNIQKFITHIFQRRIVMKKMHSLRFVAASLGITAPLWLLSSVQAEDFNGPVSQYWAESMTDSTGFYNSPDSNTNISGGVLIAPIPTDASLISPDNEVVNYVRTRTDLPGAAANYNGVFLGDISGTTGLTSTFSVFNGTMAQGQPFTSSQFVGEGTGPQLTAPPDANDPLGYSYNSGTPTPSIRFVFTGGTTDVNANGAGDMEPNEWWSATSAANLTSMTNGVNTSITAAFDPSQWTNVDGKAGNDPLVAGQFQSALTDVQYLGLSFGSGFFYSDGWGFDTGGNAFLVVDSINSVPEPASLSLVAVGAIGLLRRRRRSA
jgi:hypothetical protein